MSRYTWGSALLCKHPSFQRFLQARCDERVASPAAAAQQVRRACGVASRRELDTNPAAGDAWRQLVSEFNAWAAAESRPAAPGA